MGSSGSRPGGERRASGRGDGKGYAETLSLSRGRVGGAARRPVPGERVGTGKIVKRGHWRVRESPGQECPRECLPCTEVRHRGKR